MNDRKKQMKRMKLDWLKATAPGFFEASGGYTMTVPGYSDSTANALTKAIIDFIRFRGGDANRINTSGIMRRVNGKNRWTYGGTRKGTADIHAICQGRHISIEVKIGKDRMSDDQRAEQTRVEKAGGLYFVARNMPDFIAWFDKTFQIVTSDTR
jgi:hypothetical protein